MLCDNIQYAAIEVYALRETIKPFSYFGVSAVRVIFVPDILNRNLYLVYEMNLRCTCNMLVQVTHCVEVGLRTSQLKHLRIVCRVGLKPRSGIFKRRFHNAYGRTVIDLASARISMDLRAIPQGCIFSPCIPVAE
jgi:hypothetical protein